MLINPEHRKCNNSAAIEKTDNATLRAAVLSAGDGASGILRGAGGAEILRYHNSAGTLHVVDHVIDCTALDGSSPAFSQGHPGSGADLIWHHLSDDTERPWSSDGLNFGENEGALEFAFLGDFSSIGFIAASADFLSPVTTPDAAQILGMAGFIKNYSTAVIMGGIARASSAWRSLYIWGDPAGTLNIIGSSKAAQTRYGAPGKIFTAFWASATGRLASTYQSQLAGGYAGDETAPLYRAHHVNAEDTLSAQDTPWQLAVAARKGTGDAGSFLRRVSWHSHERPGGATP